MVKRFPQLEGVRITHAWNGLVPFAFDRRPHMGERDGIHFCMGCNGSGVAMMPYLGYKVAQRLLETTNEAPCAFDDGSFPTRPFYRGDPAWILPIVGGSYRLRDTFERVLAGRMP